MVDSTLTDQSYDYAFTYNASFSPQSSSFEPIGNLFRTTKDSDLLLLWLSANDIIFTSEVNDDWYAAHRFYWNTSNSDFDGEDPPIYQSDEPASALGCKLQYEACGPGSTSNCSVSGGILDLQNPTIPADSEAYSTITYVTNDFADMGNVVTSLMASSLTARRGLNQGYQGPLPDNQWQFEVGFLHNIGLVSLQSLVNSAIGPDDPNILQYFWQAPDSFQREKFCQNQVPTTIPLPLGPKCFLHVPHPVPT